MLCDSTVPQCVCCQNSKLDCLGYATNAVKGAPYRVSPDSEHGYSLIVSDDKAHHVQERLPNHSQINGIMKALAPFDREYFAMLEAITAFNGVVLPRAFPSVEPFKHDPIHGDMITLVWLVWPKVLQYLFIIDVRFMESGFSPSGDPLARHELVRYRGMGLAELRKLLPHAVSDPHGTALIGIIILMAADLNISSKGAWAAHHAAAQRIISLRGGATKCMRALPSCHTIFVTFMMIDMMSATTTKSADLAPTLFDAHREYLTFLPDMAKDILDFGSFCPLPLLTSIINTTLLRAQKQKQKPKSPSCQKSKPLQTFDQIQHTLLTFDAGLWADRTLTCNAPAPHTVDKAPSPADLKALTALALAYKGAALLYLHLSTRSFRGRGLHTTLDAARALLLREASFLVESGTNVPDGPLTHTLWRHIGWPLVILAFASVLSPRVPLSEVETEEVALLRRVGERLSARKLGEAVEVAQSVWDSRRADPARQWSWDELFGERRSFAF